MKLGLALGYWGAAPPSGTAQLVEQAEALGFDALFTSEAYGSDALSPLAWWGSRTQKLRLGTAVAQLYARPPAATAMAAATLDHLSGGRVILGLGVSGPQVVEGWYGSEFRPPLRLTREYIAIIRQILTRREPLTFTGEEYQLPRPGGQGKALSLTVHPLRSDLPIWLGAEGPRNIALAGELADGWLAGFHSPERSEWQRQALDSGFRRRGDTRPGQQFEVAANLPLVVDSELERAADRIRPLLALYIGGMGTAAANFHNRLFCRMGFEAEASHIQELYLGGDRRAAAAAVPTGLVEAVALVGPLAKIREEASRWRKSMATMLLISGSSEDLRLAAELFL